MYLVVAVQSILDVDDRADCFSRILNMTPYEARQHASVPLPRVVTFRADADQALFVAQQLAEEMVASAVLGPNDIITDARRFMARTLLCSELGIAVTRRDGAAGEVAWADLTMVIASIRKGGKASLDLVDVSGSVVCVREGEALFEGSGLPTGSRAAIQALTQAARQYSNARIDETLTRPNALPRVLGGLAVQANAEDWAVRVVMQGHL